MKGRLARQVQKKHRLLHLVVLVGVACVLLPSSAHAASLSVTHKVLGDAQGPVVVDVVSFEAAPGERNDVRLEAGPHGPGTESFVFRDRVAITTGEGCSVTAPNGTAATCTLGSRTQRQESALASSGESPVMLNLGDLDDRAVTAGFGSPTSIEGDAGNDTLLNDGEVFVRFSGGPGNDRVDVGGSVDECFDFDGGVVDEGTGPNGSDIIRGEQGTVAYGARTAPLSISLNGLPDDGEAGEKDDVGPHLRVQAGAGADHVTGDSRANTIVGGEGADVLRGGGGDDVLIGSGLDPSQKRTIQSGAPTADRLYGGSGNDRLTGTPGPNLLDGGRGLDTLRGAAGDDVLTTSDKSADDADCGPGDDRAVLDNEDFFRRDGVRACEHTRRPRPGAAIELGGASSLRTRDPQTDQDGASFEIACPGDGPNVCRGLLLLRSRHTTVGVPARFAVPRDRVRRLFVKTTRAGRRLILKDLRSVHERGVRAQPELITRNRRGRKARIRLRPRVYTYYEGDYDGPSCP